MGGALGITEGEPMREKKTRSRLKTRIRRLLAPGVPPGYSDLQNFVDAVRDKNAPPAAVMKRLAGSFDEILEGKPADQALRLQRQGRKPPNGKDLHIRATVAYRVEDLRRKGRTREVAIAEVADQTRGLSESRVRQWYEAHREDALRFMRLMSAIKKDAPQQ